MPATALAGQLQLRQEPGRPAALAGGEALRGRGIGVLGHLTPGHPVVEQVRHEQERGGRGELGIAGEPHSGELVECVEGQTLDAGPRIQRLRWYAPVDLLRYPRGALVAVMVGVAQQPPRRVQQREVHPPGVDADPGGRPVLLRGVLRESRLDLLPEPQRVPIETAHHLRRVIRKAVQLAQIEAPPVPPPDHYTATGGAQVDREKVLQLMHRMTPTWPARGRWRSGECRARKRRHTRSSPLRT